MNTKQWLKHYGKHIVGDDTYVSDGSILLKKSEIDTGLCSGGYNFVLKRIKTHEQLPVESIPYEHGKDVVMQKYAQLRENNRLFVDFDKFHFDYEYLKLADDILDIHYFTLATTPSSYCGKPVLMGILKFWNEDDRFLGCLSSCSFREEIKQ